MLLVDIGNTNVKSFTAGKSKRWAIDDFIFSESKFYFINVNPDMGARLAKMPQAVDLSSWFDFQTAYRGLGIDRIAVCYDIRNGIVVDAGSAVTVDVMKDGMHQGGFILPGLGAYKESFANISSKLTYTIDKRLTFDTLPLNTNDALQYATVKSLILMIQDTARTQDIFMTGGDGKMLCRYLSNCQYDENLVFKGMHKVIKEKEIC